MIIFIGPSGAGKSLQSCKIAGDYDWNWLSVGEMLRSLPNNSVKNTTLNGDLVESKVIFNLVKDSLDKIGDQQVIIDGFPRSVEQAEWFVNGDGFYKNQIQLVVVFDISNEETFKRLGLRGRADDNKTVIEKKLQLFHYSINNILAIFKQANLKVVHVDAMGTESQVRSRIEKELKECELI